MAYDAGAIIARLLANAEGFLGTMDRAEKKVDDVQKRTETLNKGFRTLAITGTAVAAAVTAFTAAGIGGNAQMEQMSVSMRVLLKDEQKATEAFEYLARLADTTPFMMPEVVGAGRLLAAYGLDIKQYINEVLNLAAGMGKTGEEVANAFGKLAAGATGEAMERFREMGISAKDFMEEGIRFAKSGQMQSSVEEAMAALQRIIQNKFGGMIEEQSKTWNGLISTLKDKLAKFNREATEDLFSGAKGALKGLIALIDDIDPGIARIIGSMTLLAGALGLVVAGYAMWNLWQKQVLAAQVAINLAMKATFTNPWVLGIAAVIGLVVAIKGVADAQKRAREEAEKAQKANHSLAESYHDISDKLGKAKQGTQEHKDLSAQLQKTMNDLAKAYPQIVKEYDNLGNVRRIDIDLLQQLIDKEKELERIRLENANKEKLRRAEQAVARAKEAVADVERRIKEFEARGTDKWADWEVAEARKLLATQQAEANAALLAANNELAAVKRSIATGGKSTTTGATAGAKKGATTTGSSADDTTPYERAIALMEHEIAIGKLDLDQQAARLDAIKKLAKGQDELWDIEERIYQNKQDIAAREADAEEKRRRKAEETEEAVRATKIQTYDLTHNAYEQEMADLDREIEEKRQAGVDEVTLTEWAAAKRNEIETRYLNMALEEEEKRRKEAETAERERLEQQEADRKREFDAELDLLKHRIAMGELTLDQQIQEYEHLLSIAKTTEEQYALEEKLYQLRKQAAELSSPVDTSFWARITGGGFATQQERERYENGLDTKTGEVLNAFQQLGRSAELLAGKFIQGVPLLGNVINAIRSGNWVSVILELFSQTKSFQNLMKMLNIFLKPVIDLFDLVFMPVIRAIAWVWNGIIDILAWLFPKLKKYKISFDDEGNITEEEEAGQSSAAGSSGVQIGQFTGPDRDLLISLLKPLADLPNAIRNLTDSLLNLNTTLSGQYALPGGGALPAGIVWNVDTINNYFPSAPSSGSSFFDDLSQEANRTLGQKGG
jgi:hypothetical protein